MRYILLRHQLPMLPGIRLIDTYISPMRATGLLGAVMPRFGIKFSGIFWMCTYTAVLRNCQQNLDNCSTRRVWPPVGSNGSISSGPLLATDPTAGSTGYISHWVATSSASATTVLTGASDASVVKAPADNHRGVVA